MSAYLAKVNRTKVPAELLAEAVGRHAEMESERRGGFEARAIELFELLKANGFTGRRQADLAVAVQFRLEALAHVVADNQARGWTIPGTERGQAFLHPCLLAAAAEEPLIEGAENRVAFDLDSFRDRVLRLAGTAGHA